MDNFIEQKEKIEKRIDDIESDLRKHVFLIRQIAQFMREQENFNSKVKEKIEHGGTKWQKVNPIIIPR